MKILQELNSASERIIHFYTFNDGRTQEFGYEVPKYAFDYIGSSYDNFTRAGSEIAKILQDTYGVRGEYVYDIKVSLQRNQEEHDIDFTYGWEILRTDNPRCIFGNPIYRKDCSYLRNTSNSKLKIDGYTLSGNYHKFVDVLSDLSHKTILVHSKADARALLRILKFLGVNYVMKEDKVFLNSPNRRAFFSKDFYGYQLGHIDGQTIVYAIHYKNLSLHPEDVLDIDEFIVKRTWQSKLRDTR